MGVKIYWLGSQNRISHANFAWESHANPHVFAVVKGAMVVKTPHRKISGKNCTLKKLILTSFTVYGYFRASGASGVVPEGQMGAWEWVLERSGCGFMWPYMIDHIPITLLMPPTFSFTVYGYFRALGASGVMPEGHMGAWEWVLER